MRSKRKKKDLEKAEKVKSRKGKKERNDGETNRA